MRPWYREPWPWLLMSGPVAVVIAGAVTIWIAFASADGLVAEDYYKQGLSINKVLAREDAARASGISASVTLAEGKLEVRLKGEAPPALFARLAHATREGHDLRLRLAPGADGTYAADLPPLPRGRWHIVIEDPRATWRIAKEAS